MATNIRLLGSGHNSYLLKKYMHLYTYSYQSWNNLDKRIKRLILIKTHIGVGG